MSTDWWILKKVDAKTNVLSLYREVDEKNPQGEYTHMKLLSNTELVTVLQAALDSGDVVDCKVVSGQVTDWSCHPWCPG